MASHVAGRRVPAYVTRSRLDFWVSPGPMAYNGWPLDQGPWIMLIVDDPLLALIVRFCSDPDTPDETNQEFVRYQVQALKEYVGQFPETERGAKAMEWIQKYAAGYRRNWQNRTVARRTLEERCRDCPLGNRGATEHCEIHEQWLYLLKRYMDGEMMSKKYVKDALQLLRSHKKRLQRRSTDEAGVADKPHKRSSSL